jgi:hypothetical protein
MKNFNTNNIEIAWKYLNKVVMMIKYNNNN